MRFIGKQSIQFALSLLFFVSASLSTTSLAATSPGATSDSAASDSAVTDRMALKLETVIDLRVLQKQAGSSNLPVLLLLTAEECDYCEAIRSHYLEPMIRSGKYDSSLLFRQLYIDEFHYLRNHRGELVGGDQIALKYDVEVTPTILFIDASGKELADRIVGLSGADYFDRTLDTHISQAQSNFQK